MAALDKIILKPLKKVTDSLGEDVVQSLKDKDRYATGDTAKAIKSEQKIDSAQLTAPGYIQDLEFGKKKGELPSESKIRRWCEARGISPNRVDSIRAKIYLKGYKGRAGVLTDPLSTANINATIDRVLEQVAVLVTSQINKELK